METLAIREATPYPDVNEVLVSLTQGASEILGDDLVGMYLTGSLTYGDFNPGRSDIDLVAVVRRPLSETQLERIKGFHKEVEKENQSWEKRIECSYVPQEMLKEILPPESPRPYVGEGKFYAEAPYGNEWIINNYLLYKHGVALTGPEFKTLVPPIDIQDVKKACVRDVFTEWVPKINDQAYLENSHNQSYVVLNLCRILHTIEQSKAGTKGASTQWAKEAYPEWKGLIQEAENWQYGSEMGRQEEAKKFIAFVAETISPLRESTRTENGE